MVSCSTAPLTLDKTNQRVGLRTVSPAHRLHITHTADNQDGIRVTWAYGDGGSGAKAAGGRVFTEFRATDMPLGTSIGPVGLHSTIYSGGSTSPVAAKGTVIGVASEIVVTRSGDATNEQAPFYGSLRYDIGEGYAHDALPGRAWMMDLSVHGAVRVQQEKLDGITMLMNNYYDGSPSASRSAGMWVVSAPGTGGSVDVTHAEADTYAVDVGIGVIGRSRVAGPTYGVGFTKAIQIGGNGSGWNPGSSIIGTGIDISDWRAYGIKISGREASGAGPAVAVAASAGGVIVGATAADHSSTLLELHATGTHDPLVKIRSSGATDSFSMWYSNAAGGMKIAVAGSTNAFVTGVVAGDVALYPTASGKKIVLAGTSSVLAVTQDNKLGFFNKSPAAKPTVTGSRGSNDALASLLTALSDFGLVVDSTS